jgi:hypothetical protein
MLFYRYTPRPPLRFATSSGVGKALPPTYPVRLCDRIAVRTPEESQVYRTECLMFNPPSGLCAEGAGIHGLRPRLWTLKPSGLLDIYVHPEYSIHRVCGTKVALRPLPVRRRARSPEGFNMHSRRPKAYGYMAFPRHINPEGVEPETICISLIYSTIYCLSLVASEAEPRSS